MPEFRFRTSQVARGIALCALTLTALRGAALAADVACRPQPRAQDEVWLISSRGLGSCDLPTAAERLRFWRFDRARSWVRSNQAQFVATDDPQITTVVFLHGNRMSHGEAFVRGWIAYRKLVAGAPERPVRFVIWSWPSEQIRGPLNDVRVKAARCDPQGYFLACWLDRLRPDVPVALWGYSFGARIATAALHLSGGGTVAGHRLASHADKPRRPMQAALLAAAVDDDWLLPGHRHGRALSQLDGTLLINNACDRVLMRYHWIYCRGGCQQALGYVGLAKRLLPVDLAESIQQIDAGGRVGGEHVFANYLASSYLMARIRARLLSGGLPTTSPAQPTPQTAAQPSEAGVELAGN